MRGDILPLRTGCFSVYPFLLSAVDVFGIHIVIEMLGVCLPHLDHVLISNSSKR